MDLTRLEYEYLPETWNPANRLTSETYMSFKDMPKMKDMIPPNIEDIEF